MNNSNFIILKKIKCTNFNLFGLKELEFSHGVNLIPFFSEKENNSLELLFKIFFNPEKSLNSGTDIVNVFKSRFDNENDKIIEFELENLHNEGNKYIISSSENSFNESFLNSSLINLKFILSSNNGLSLKLLNLRGDWIELSPRELNIWNSVIINIFWIDQQFSPFYDLNFASRLFKSSSADLFDILLSLTNLKTPKEKYYILNNSLQKFLNESDQFNEKILTSQKTKQVLEDKLNLFNKITLIDEKLEELSIEMKWAPYFEIKDKIKILSSNIPRMTSKNEENKKRLIDLDEKNITVSLSIEQLLEEKSKLTSNYEAVRKQLLSEKHLLDQNERNLKVWEVSIKKLERDIKYSKMQLKDKEKKLLEIINRLKKDEESIYLEKSKLNLENEVKQLEKDNNNKIERLNGLKSEKNRKLNSKSIKEKKIQPINTEINVLNIKIKTNQKELDQNEKYLKEILGKKSILENELARSSEIISKMNSDSDLLKKDLESALIETKKIKSNKLDQGRSIQVLNTIKDNLINEKNRLANSLQDKNIKKRYEDHLYFLDSLENESNFIKDQIQQLKLNLDDWEKNWEVLFNKEIKSLFLNTKEMLKHNFADISFNVPKSVLPEEGYIQIYYSLKDRAELILLENEYDSNNFLIIVQSIIFSSILSSQHIMTFYDNYFIKLIPNKNLIDIIRSINKKINQTRSIKTKYTSQLIISYNETKNNLLDVLKEVDNINIILRK